MAGVGVADPSTLKQARQDPNKVQRGHFTMPLWAWAAVGGGLLFFGYKVYKAKSSATAAGSSAGTATSTTGATATGCVDANGNATPCPVYVPVPTATQTGNTPAEEGQYNSLIADLGSLQGQLSQPLVTATLEPGEQINVPTQVNTPSAWDSVAKAWGISTAHLLNNNPGDTAASTPASGEGINVPYLVKSGDTWASIAARDKISPLHLEQNNPTLLGPGGTASGSQSNPVNAQL